MNRAILHYDCDAFFASVEQAFNPTLRGKAVIIGGEKRGVVTSASYEARRFGVHAGMPSIKAKKLCPNGLFITPNFSLYPKYSDKVFQIISNYTPQVEKTSIDEGYLDLTGTEILHKKSYLEISWEIMNRIYKSLGITISCGLATNRTIAKIAANQNKPFGLTYIPAGYEFQFLKELPIKVLPGVGAKLEVILHSFDIKTLGQFADFDKVKLQQKLGVVGLSLQERARGKDTRPVSRYIQPRKSISKEITFIKDSDKHFFIWAKLKTSLIEILQVLRKQDLKGRTLCLKIRYSDFQTHTFSKTLCFATNREKDFITIAKFLLEKNNNQDKKIRLIGVSISNLVNASYNKSLFDLDDYCDVKLTESLDRIREKFGFKSIKFGDQICKKRLIKN